MNKIMCLVCYFFIIRVHFTMPVRHWRIYTHETVKLTKDTVLAMHSGSVTKTLANFTIKSPTS